LTPQIEFVIYSTESIGKVSSVWIDLSWKNLD